MTISTAGNAWSEQHKTDDLVHLRRRTVICSDDIAREKNPSGTEELKVAVEGEVDKLVKSIIQGIHDGTNTGAYKCSGAWQDPDFGPSRTDPLGTNALYRNGRQATPGYPKPEQVKWERPQQQSGAQASYFSRNVSLFKGEVNKANIIQGKLGDCWFLSAVAIASSKPELIKACFWRLDDFKDYGIYVCKFFKNDSWYYVFIDDQIPLFNCENGQPCFARSRDPEELWPLLLEKAYAKLHFSYDSLACGLVDVALREITGLCADRLLLNAHSPLSSSENDTAGQESFESETLWRKLRESLDYGSVVGCIIQPEQDGPNVASVTKAKRDHIAQRYESPRAHPTHTSGAVTSVLPSAIRGLEKRHAYNVLATKIIGGHKIVLLRNPWGFGKWLGPWSKLSPERKKYSHEISTLFSHGELEDESNFIIGWSDFISSFTSLLKTVSTANSEMGSQWVGGFFAHSKWSDHTAGGGVDKETWFLNPRFKLRVRDPQTRIFIQVFLHDRRMERSKYVNQNAYSFSICEANPREEDTPTCPDNFRSIVPGSNPRVFQPDYTFHPSSSKEMFLTCGDYYIVPHTFDRDIRDRFSIFLFYDKPVFLKNAISLGSENVDSGIEASKWHPLLGNSGGGDEALPTSTEQNDLAQSVTEQKKRAQKAEHIKEKLAAIAKKREISVRRILNSFEGNTSLNRFEYKQRMVNLGYSVSEIPDAEFETLAYPNTTIPSSKIRSIFEQDSLKQILQDTKPTAIHDDLMFRPPPSAQGSLTVNALQGQDLVLPYHHQRNDIFVSELRRQPLQVVYRSPIITISSRPVIVHVWQLVSKPHLPGVLIAYATDSGKDYPFLETPSIEFKEEQLLDDDFWAPQVKTWQSSLNLNHDALENKLGATGPKGCYIPNRLRYIEEVLRISVNDSLATNPSQQLSGLGLAENTDGDDLSALGLEKQDTLPSRGFENHANVLNIIPHVREIPETSKMDELRNHEFFKLGLLSRDMRRGHAQKVVLDSLNDKPPTGLNEEQTAKLEEAKAPKSRKSSAVVETPEQTTNDNPIDHGPVDGPFASLIKDIFYEDMLSRAEEVIHITRDGVEIGGWVKSEKEPSSERSQEKDEHKVYSRVIPVPGEAKVRKEELSRSANLESWFNKFDRDKSGNIDKREFQQALTALGFSLSPEEMNSLINHLDKNGDGSIDSTEFADFIRGDDNQSPNGGVTLYLQDLLSALASPSIDKDLIDKEAWSLGTDWFKLRNFASQMHDLTKGCKSAAHRSAFACEPKLVAIRAYRVAHFFVTPENFVSFLKRAQTAPRVKQTEGQEALPLISEPEQARAVLTTILSSMLPGAHHDKDNKIDLDLVVKGLPQFLDEIGMSVSDGVVKAGVFSKAILTAHAKTIVTDRLAEEFHKGKNENKPKPEKTDGNEPQLSEQELARQREEKMLAEELTKFETELLKPLFAPEGTHQVELTLAQQMRMLVDDALIYCKATSVTKSALARMLNPDNVYAVEMKLRHILRQQRAARDGPVCALVDIYAKTVTPENYTTLRVVARDPDADRTLTLDNIQISDEEASSLPRKGGVWYTPGRRIVNNGASVHGCPELWSTLSTEPHFLDDLASRLVVSKSSKSAGNRLALALKECPKKVQFVRDVLDSCAKLPFFYQVSDTTVHFLVDEGHTQDCKNKVLHALRTQQGNRVARSLSKLSSVLRVSFEQTHGDFREEMSWSEFSAYLAELRNSVLQIKVNPDGEKFTTKIASDGGFNPVFESSCSNSYTPVCTANRNLVLTRVCRIGKRYMILFVHHVADRNDRFGVVAYDPRSNDEYTITLKTIEDIGKKNSKGKRRSTLPFGHQSITQPWASPKGRHRGHFSPTSRREEEEENKMLFEPETLRLIEMYSLIQESTEEGLALGTNYPLHDDTVWEKILEHVQLGKCLTPHVEFSAYNKLGVGEQDKLIGKAQFPLSIVVNNPGQEIERWISLLDEDGKDRGKINICFRFDDAVAKSESTDRTPTPEANTSSDPFAQFDNSAGDEAFAPPDDGESNVAIRKNYKAARSAQDYSVLAQRLRDEMADTKAKLAESEKDRQRLEEACRANEDRLRHTRNEIERQRRKLEEAEALTNNEQPRPPKRGASHEDRQEHSKLKLEHQAKLHEIEMLKSENNKLRVVTDTRESRLMQEMNQLRAKLEEIELKHRLEVTEKQELLSRIEKANVDAHVNLANSANGPYNTNIGYNQKQYRKKSKDERDRERMKRDRWLQDRLGKKYNTYKAELDSCLAQLESSLTSRRPDKPDQPLQSLERLMLANASPNRNTQCIPADAFQEVLLDFGLRIKPADMELLITHFDTNGDNKLSIDDFMDSLREYTSNQRVAQAGFRGVQTMRNRY